MDEYSLREFYERDKELISAEILQVLLDMGLVLTPTEWNYVISVAISGQDVDLFSLALKHTNPTSKNNALLLRVASMTTGRKLLEILLADPRVDPTVNIGALVDKTWNNDLIARHPKVVFSQLDAATRRRLYNRLLTDKNIPVNKLVSPPDTYWKLAGHMLAKKPSSEQILGYIKAHFLKRSEVREALASVFDEDAAYNEEVAALRALLLFLIYPKMSMEESTKYLREVDGYSDDMIEQANLLIGLVGRDLTPKKSLIEVRQKKRRLYVPSR